MRKVSRKADSMNRKSKAIQLVEVPLIDREKQ